MLATPLRDNATTLPQLLSALQGDASDAVCSYFKDPFRRHYIPFADNNIGSAFLQRNRQHGYVVQEGVNCVNDVLCDIDAKAAQGGSLLHLLFKPPRSMMFSVMYEEKPNRRNLCKGRPEPQSPSMQKYAWTAV